MLTKLEYDLLQTLDRLLDVVADQEFYAEDECPFCNVACEYEPGEPFPHERDCSVYVAVSLVASMRGPMLQYELASTGDFVQREENEKPQ